MSASSTAVDPRFGSFDAAAVAQHAVDFGDVRAAAIERAVAAPWPTPDEEIWRYSRIDELQLADFRPAALTTELSGDQTYVVSAGEAYPAVVDGDAPDVFHELNTAFAAPLHVVVPAGKVSSEPLVITHRAEGAGAAVFPRLVIDAGENSEVTVVERFLGDPATLTVPVVQIRAARAARVRYLVVNEIDDASAWLIGHQQAVGAADSDVSIATISLGGHYARFRTEARIVGPGANTKQSALYFAAGEQMHDFRTIQDHDAPRATSNLLFKGAVQDDAASVYTGLIKVRPEARGTAAFQTNRNLTLGAGSWAQSVPNLEIETNEVSCSHASTVGPVDLEHRFYLESRGIPTAVADRLIVIGFFDEVLDQLTVRPIAEEVRRIIVDKVDLEQVAASAERAGTR